MIEQWDKYWYIWIGAACRNVDSKCEVICSGNPHHSPKDISTVQWQYSPRVKNTMFPSLIVNQHFFPSSWIVLIDCLKIFHRFWSCSLVPDSPIIISWLFPLAFPSYLNDIPIIFTTCSCHSNIIMSYIICKKVLYHSLFMTLNIPYSYISLVYIPLYTDTLNIPSILGPEVKAAEVRDSSDSSAAVGWCFFFLGLVQQ